jgi:hypothetical protein
MQQQEITRGSPLFLTVLLDAKKRMFSGASAPLSIQINNALDNLENYKNYAKEFSSMQYNICARPKIVTTIPGD